MDTYSQDFFEVRSPVPALHQESIRSDVDVITTDVVNLVHRVFEHLPAVFGSRMPVPYPEFTGGADDPLPSVKWLAWNFYNGPFYCDVEVRRDTSGPVVDIDQFVHELCTFDPEPNRNQLFFLQGKVGSGKTAFINYLITKKGMKIFRQKNTWFLRLNVDVDRYRGPDPIGRLFTELCHKLVAIIRKLSSEGDIKAHISNEEKHEKLAGIVNRLKASSFSERTENNESRYVFIDAVRDFSKLIGRRPLLILDNLDWYFHENDRFLFLSDVDTGEHPFLKTVNELVQEFYHGRARAGELGANVLFVLRNDSYLTLRESRVLFAGTDGPFPDNLRTFTLEAPNWTDIVIQRTHLLGKAMNEVKKDGLRKTIAEALNPVIEAVRVQARPQALIGSLHAMGPFGLRSVMEFFKKYTWLNREPGAGLQRHIEHYTVGLMCFMLRGYRHFSQNTSHFPNLYYINVSPDDEEYSRSFVQEHTNNAHAVLVAHPHTYWLKRLLLAYVLHCNDRSLIVTTRNIEDLFCGHGTEFYQSGLVRLTLGSFAQTHFSNLVEPTRHISSDGRRVVVHNIELTMRARHCLDKVFDRFFYLQLIVDDHLLPIPRVALADYGFDVDKHYGYLVKAGHAYRVGLGDMVSRKAPSVVKFLAILAEAFDCEKQKYEPVFSKLATRNVRLPDVDEIVAGLWQEFGALEPYVPGAFDIAVLQSRYMEWREQIRPVLRQAYRV